MLILKHSLKLSSEPFAAPKAYAGLVIVGGYAIVGLKSNYGGTYQIECRDIV